MVNQENEQKKIIHVLCVEDSDADAELVSESLRDFNEPKFIIDRVVRLKEAFDYLKTHNPDVVLLDLNLPDSRGFDTVKKLITQAPELPIVVLTGSDDKTLGIRTIKEGVQDYLEKEHIQSNLLNRIIFYAMERKKNILALGTLLEKERVAREIAEKAIELRDEFISIASHEFRSPLSVLKMHIQLLIGMLEKSKDEYFLNAAKIADRQLARFCHLVEKLFDYSQIQSGRLKLEYSSCDLIQILKDSIELLAPEVKKAGCDLILNLGSDAKSIDNGSIMGEWDRLRLSQVFINLLSNALKYAPGKPIEISVSNNNENVRLSFKDHGPGITAQNKDKIFQRFVRLEETKKVAGLGLGLYVARQIISEHDGTIEVESNPGEGATFVINLPRKSKETQHNPS